MDCYSKQYVTHKISEPCPCSAKESQRENRDFICEECSLNDPNIPYYRVLLNEKLVLLCSHCLESNKGKKFSDWFAYYAPRTKISEELERELERRSEELTKAFNKDK
jgi:hypothetical protein